MAIKLWFPAAAGDEPCAVLGHEVGPKPGEHHHHAAARPDQEEDVRRTPGQPARQAAQAHPAEVHDCRFAADGGEIAIVTIPKDAGRRPSRESPYQKSAHIGACLFGRRSAAGYRVAVGIDPRAVSPITKMLLSSGKDRPGPQRTRPPLSGSAPSHFAAGDAETPAARINVRASIRCPAATAPSASRSSTSAPNRISTPNCPRERRALATSDCGKAESIRRPASTKVTHARWPYSLRC